MVVGFYLVSLSLSEYLDPRTRLSRLTVGEQIDGGKAG